MTLHVDLSTALPGHCKLTTSLFHLVTESSSSSTVPKISDYTRCDRPQFVTLRCVDHPFGESAVFCPANPCKICSNKIRICSKRITFHRMTEKPDGFSWKEICHAVAIARKLLTHTTIHNSLWYTRVGRLPN